MFSVVENMKWTFIYEAHSLRNCIMHIFPTELPNQVPELVYENVLD